MAAKPKPVTGAQLRAHYDSEVERLNAELAELGEDGFELDDADRTLIDRLAVQVDQVLKLERDIARNGPLITSAMTGDSKANPAVALHLRVSTEIGKLIATLDRRLAATSGIEEPTKKTGPKPGTPKGFRGAYKPRQATGTDNVAVLRPAPKHSRNGGRRMSNGGR